MRRNITFQKLPYCDISAGGSVFVTALVVALALLSPAMAQQSDEGVGEDATDNIFIGRFVLDEGGGPQLLEITDWSRDVRSVEVTELGKDLKPQRNWLVAVEKGTFRLRTCINGMQYRIRLHDKRHTCAAPTVPYTGEWTFVYPLGQREYSKSLPVTKAPHRTERLTVELRIKNMDKPVRGARLALTQLDGQIKRRAFLTTNDAGLAPFHISHRPGAAYQLSVPSHQGGIERDWLKKAPWEREYPRVRSFETEPFRLDEVGDRYVWRLEPRNRQETLVVEVQGLEDVGESTRPDIYMWTETPHAAQAGYFEGIRTRKENEGRVVKECWIFDKRGRRAAHTLVVMTDEGHLVDMKQSDYKTCRDWVKAELYRIEDGRWRGVFFDVPPGDYYGLQLGDWQMPEDVVLEDSGRIQIKPDSELPVLVNVNATDTRSAPQYATVIGTVTDKKGQAFAGALIQAKGRGGPGTSNNTYATTSEDGSFELGKLKPGNYVIKAECANGRTLVVVRHLSPGRHRVQFRGQRAPSFSGRVVDSAGRAVANASLEAIELGAPSKHGVSTVADKDGRYQLTVPTDGVTYAVAAEAAVSNTQDGWHIHFLEKKVNGPGTKLDITLPDTVRINGKIILPDALRSRIENSGVLAIKSMRYASSLSYPGVKTSNDYSFVLDLVPGRYNLFFVGALLQEKGKKLKHPMVPLGVFDVPDDEAEVVYEKNLTKSMFQEAWTLKEFRRRIKEARSEVGQAVDN